MFPSDLLNTLTHQEADPYLAALPDACVPLFLFSPPYNLGNTSGGGMPGRGRMGHYAANAGMKKRGGGHHWSGGKLADGYDDYDQRIIWARAGGVNFSPAFYLPTYEEILIIARPDWRLKSKGASGAGDVWSIPQVAGTWHPAPFPQPLADRVVETTGTPLIVDIFAGSGTTAKAAKRYGVDYAGCDRNAAYLERARAEIAAERRLTHRQAALLPLVEQEALL